MSTAYELKDTIFKKAIFKLSVDSTPSPHKSQFHYFSFSEISSCPKIHILMKRTQQGQNNVDKEQQSWKTYITISKHALRLQ